MNVLLDVLKVIGAVALGIIVILIGLYAGIGFGYLVGMLLAILPFISEWLTEGLPVSTQQLPGIVAWLAVAGMFIGGGSKVAAKRSEEGDGET